MEKRIQTILFDLDGTLVDTEPAAEKALKTQFVRWGLKINEPDAQFITGRTWEAAVHFLAKKYPFPCSHEKALKLLLQSYRQALKKELIILPGAIRAVRLFSEKKYKLGLVSGSNRKDILFSLKQMGVDSLFHLILGCEDYKGSKPDPEPYLQALKGLSAHPLQTLVFEDSTAGIRAAIEAGTWVTAVRVANHTGQIQSDAHDSLSSLKDVTLSWLKSFEKKYLLT